MERLFTLGHSNKDAEEFLALLAAEPAIERLVDVRRFPGSKRHPHFGREALAATLADAGIDYEHLPDLGGRRRGHADSPNTAWRNLSFRAYADYMLGPEFQTALAHLEELGRQRWTAVMCSEAVYWRCHRRLIADALVVRGWRVSHRLGPGQDVDHELHPDAVVEDGVRLTYPAPSERQEILF
ncbi:MAG: DUF488 domain-containing protein [Acidobacteriota bacterium]